MGLDIVEFVIAVEGALDIAIPDKDAERLETPRMLIDYLAQRLDATGQGEVNCLSQHSFYRARRAAAKRFGIENLSLHPQTLLSDIMGSRQSEWEALRDDVGSTEWPKLKSDNWFTSGLGGVTTLGELAQHLAAYDVAAMRDPHTPWSRKEIQAVVISLLETDLGIDMNSYTLDSQFVRDMGLD
jgi:acyl carrier protein